MKNPELYNKTVDILVKAYFNDTLEHGNCYACAVGNMIAATTGLRIIKDWDGIYWEGYSPYMENEIKFPGWLNLILGRTDSLNTSRNLHEAKLHLASTGYTIPEIKAIESAFENVDEGKSEDEYMFNGLMAVIDVLDEIHEVDSETTLQTKKKFQRA